MLGIFPYPCFASWVNQKETKPKVLTIATLLHLPGHITICRFSTHEDKFKPGSWCSSESLNHHWPWAQPKDNRHDFLPATSCLHSSALAERPPPRAWDRGGATNGRDPSISSGLGNSQVEGHKLYNWTPLVRLWRAVKDHCQDPKSNFIPILWLG